jgi:Pvc16 N-terminal domain
MIAEVDAALEALVRRDALNGTKVDILFDAPNKEWVARRNAPTLDLYLYDIREDLPRRQLGPEPVRDATTGYVANRSLPPRRFRLSYLVTAWTQRPEDEHRLLSACLAVLARNEFIPFDLVEGTLAASPFPVLLTVCLPPPQDRSIADVWSALGGELKPSLDLVATAPLDLGYRLPVGKPILEEPLLGIGGPGIPPEEAARARRQILEGPPPPELVPAQTELLRGAALGAPKVPVETPAARRGSRGKKTDGAAAEAEVAVGAAAAPAEPPFADLGSGRIVRVHSMERREPRQEQ